MAKTHSASATGPARRRDARTRTRPGPPASGRPARHPHRAPHRAPHPFPHPHGSTGRGPSLAGSATGWVLPRCPQSPGCPRLSLLSEHPACLSVCLVPGRLRGDEGAKCARRWERPACSQHAARPLGPTDSPWCCREQPPGRGAHGTSPEARPALQCPGSTHGLPAGDADLAGAPAFLPVTLPSRPPLQGRVWTNPGKPNWGAGRRGGGQLGGLRGPGLWFLLGFGRGWWGTGPTPSWAWGEQQGTPGWLPSLWRGTQAVALNDGHA